MSEEQLIETARAVRDRAYCPYSGYPVGAALLTADGHIFAGANVESVSYGATLCAERSAIAAMIAAGERVVTAIAVATEDGGTPCGICRQLLLEFSPRPSTVSVLTVDAGGIVQRYDLASLLPHAFGSGFAEAPKPGKQTK